jgi:hypothetical protein
VVIIVRFIFIIGCVFSRSPSTGRHDSTCAQFRAVAMGYNPIPVISNWNQKFDTETDFFMVTMRRLS